jgi:hypothetical protein
VSEGGEARHPREEHLLAVPLQLRLRGVARLQLREATSAAAANTIRLLQLPLQHRRGERVLQLG